MDEDEDYTCDLTEEENNNQISRVCAKTYFLYDGAAQSIWGQVDPLYNGESQN